MTLRSSHADAVPISPTVTAVARPGARVLRARPADAVAGLFSCGVLDHLLVDLIGTIRSSFDTALLQRQAVEERFQVDVFLGDVSWETSYSLPGEEQPPRVRADLSIDWPTWSQTAYRSWSIGEMPEEMPEVVVEVALRIQRLAEPPTTEAVMAVMVPGGPRLDGEALVRSALTIEQVHNEASSGGPGSGDGE